MASDIPSDAPNELPGEQLWALSRVENEIQEMMNSRQHYFNINWINLEELDHELIDDLKNLINTLFECITNNDNKIHRAFTFALTDHYFTSKFNAPRLYVRVEDIVSNLSKQVINIINHFIDTNHPIPSDFLENELLLLCKTYDFKLAEKVESIIVKCKSAEYRPVSRGIKYFNEETEEFVCVYDNKKRIKFKPAKLIRALIENNPLIHW